MPLIRARPLFLLEFDRLDACGGEGLSCGHELTGGVAHGALTEHRKRHMCERGEIT